jgi:predicted nucleic acid-binding protein
MADIMDIYLLDAMAFLAYLANCLPINADKILNQAEKKEVRLILPAIALGETLYTIYKGIEVFGKVIPVEKIDSILQVLQSAEILKLVDMDMKAWEIFHSLTIPELHDRIIVATALRNHVKAIITTDPEMGDAVPTIW